VACQRVTRKDNFKAEAALWMLAQLAPATQNDVRRRLALRLDPPVSPVDRRRRELTFVAQLLRSIAPRRGWSFTYVPRSQYDAQRPLDSLSSASLVARYGSWGQVCHHAYALVAERSRGELHHLPWEVRGRKAVPQYTREAVADVLKECARELNRAPSRHAYKYWRAAAQPRRRSTRGYPCANVIGRLYKERGGWVAALEDAGLLAPPAMTVRVTVASKEEAVELVASARAQALIAARPTTGNWFEVRGRIAQVRGEIVDCARTLAIADLVLWEPQMRTLERIDLFVKRPGFRRGSAVAPVP
jgi:hypothetical protein